MNEDKTSIERLASMNLEGLLLPEPAPVSYWWLWVLIGLLIIIMTWLWAKKRQTPKATALRELKQLQKILSANSTDANVNSKDISKQVAILLRQGFEVARLDNAMPNNMEWREYLSNLETMLYANNPSESQTLLSLVTSAQSWLRNN